MERLRSARPRHMVVSVAMPTVPYPWEQEGQARTAEEARVHVCRGKLKVEVGDLQVLHQCGRRRSPWSVQRTQRLKRSRWIERKG